MAAPDNDRYEPLYRDAEKKYSQEVRKNKQLTKRVESLEARLAEYKDQLDSALEKIEKLNQLLFCKPESKLRTKRPHAPKPRTAASYVRPLPEYITEEQVLVLGNCLRCDTPLGPPVSARSRITGRYRHPTQGCRDQLDH